jgi:hypothetical protein
MLAIDLRAAIRLGLSGIFALLLFAREALSYLEQ